MATKYETLTLNGVIPEVVIWEKVPTKYETLSSLECAHTIPKQHSIRTPAGPQLGQVGPQLGLTGAHFEMLLGSVVY